MPHKLIQNIKLFLSKPWGLALILIIPICVIFIKQYPQYELIKTKEGVLTDKSTMIYADFSGDGLTESIRAYQWQEGFYSFPIRKSSGEVLGQFNLKGETGRYMHESVFSGDFDKNDKHELYIILHQGDSLFLNIVEPLGKGNIIKNRFIGLVSSGKAGYDYDIRIPQLYDVNGDDKKDLAFIISAGFSIYPRTLFLYDIANDKLKKSSNLGSNPHFLDITDINGDSEPEFLISNFASSNMPLNSQGYNDNNAYLFALDKNLNPLFEPQVFKGPTQFIRIFPFTSNNKTFWAVFHKCASKYAEMGRLFYLFNYKGEIVKTFHHKHKGPESYLRVIPIEKDNKKEALVIKNSNILCHLNQDLSLTEITRSINDISFIKNVDIDRDGLEEYIMLSDLGRKIHVFRNNFKNYVSSDLKCNPSGYSVSLIKDENHSSSFFFQSTKDWFIFEYRQIAYYYLKLILIIIGIYLSAFLLVWGIQYLTAGRDRRKKRLAELQLTNWKNQLDPHFTFNTLNSVGAVILSEDRDKAYDFFTRFSKLVRYALEASNKVSVSIEDEIHFIELYLQLEQFRFNDKFEYKIDISNEINRFTQVPKMLLQTYVENAVRHGLMDRDNKGILNINIFKEEEYLIFQVKDNGIGRIASNRKRRLSNGIGMKAMKDYFELLNSINYRNISLDINDSDDTNIKYPGTIVTIKIPEDFSYEL